MIELVCATTIVAVMACVAVPVVQTTVRKHKEIELRRALREIRLAIDDYKRVIGESNIIQKTGADGYPPDLETLVKGIDMGQAVKKKMRFLRRIPIDPMTGEADWVCRSNLQERDSGFWDHNHVFDVHSKSRAKGLDGTTYATW